MKRTKKEILSHCDNVKNAKIIANNTLRIEYENGNVAIRFHDTDVVTTLPNGNKILSSGGYRTVTTKDRIGRFGEVGIYQNKGLWFIKGGNLFYDGITIDENGNVVSEKKEANFSEVEKMKNKIAKFVSKLSENNLPVPSGGDCWLCNMYDENGKIVEDNNHLLEHIKEGYLHGSLLINAMRDAGYRDEQIGFHYQLKLVDTFKRALRKYLQKRLIPNVAIK